jgi:hypothetical protein
MLPLVPKNPSSAMAVLKLGFRMPGLPHGDQARLSAGTSSSRISVPLKEPSSLAQVLWMVLWEGTRSVQEQWQQEEKQEQRQPDQKHAQGEKTREETNRAKGTTRKKRQEHTVSPAFSDQKLVNQKLIVVPSGTCAYARSDACLTLTCRPAWPATVKCSAQFCVVSAPGALAVKACSRKDRPPLYASTCESCGQPLPEWVTDDGIVTEGPVAGSSSVRGPRAMEAAVPAQAVMMERTRIFGDV